MKWEMTKKDELRREIIQQLDLIYSADNVTLLSELANDFCSGYDMGEGYKYALTMTINDQLDNHIEDISIQELEELLAKLS